MPSDVPIHEASRAPADVGLLAPVSFGHDELVTDAAVLSALVTAEVALARAWGDSGGDADAAERISREFGWRGRGEPCAEVGIDPAELAGESAAGGNPVIALVTRMKERVPESAAAVHRGATSQDILDSALLFVARRAGARIDERLQQIEAGLRAFAAAHRDDVAAARTLTQHAVPTTVGLRATGWLSGVGRARARLAESVASLPAQLGGAAGTLAALVQLGGRDEARRLPARFAAELGLAAPETPWHTSRWPVTELGDALVQTIDAVGVIAADVATLSRTEIGELSEGVGGGSSAMPQKQNPAASVLVRSAALRAPQLGATLHLAAGLAVDERPDGAWHAEWPTLRELLRLALGATATSVGLVEGLRVNRAAVARNLAMTHGLIVAERISLRLTPVLGREAVGAIVAGAVAGGELSALIRTALERAGQSWPASEVDALLDPAEYTGLAAELVDRAVGGASPTPTGEATP